MSSGNHPDNWRFDQKRRPCFGTIDYGAILDCRTCPDNMACSRVDAKGLPPPQFVVKPGTVVLDPELVLEQKRYEHPTRFARRLAEAAEKAASDGSTADYYELPPGAAQLQELISYRNMNGQDAEMFRALYRKGHCPHSSLLREAKKVLFYAQAEVDRLEKYGEKAA